ncbi:PRD domain-containing protein [Martelella mangrovi]|uniref:Beta-glucoside operon transcriptional antiterminator n=1 Tax=Martelella mangrovi TaxID=1397477 RepID=A0ABV2IDD3_9HYPH
MLVLKIFNNNVALVRDETGREVVVQGRGLAFQVRPGDQLDPTVVQRRFVPEPSYTPENFAQLIAEIPPGHIAIAETILGMGEKVGLKLDRHVVVALADHISMAIKRQLSHQSFENPLEWEVHLLYVREARLGMMALDEIERQTGVRLPDIEVVPLALHFVNAQVGARQLSSAVRTARLIRDILAMIEDEFGIKISADDSLGSARFATHLRHLFLSHLSGETYTPLIAQLAQTFKAEDPRVYECAERIGHYLTEKMDWTISEDETVYIALHIQRMTRRAFSNPDIPKE